MQEALAAARHYDRPTIWFHWTIAVLVPLQWGLAQIIDWFPEGEPCFGARSFHISAGLFIAVLLAARIFWRATKGRMLPPANKGALQTLTKSVHYALYALLTAMVLAGMFLV